MKPKLAILISGRGSNMEAIAESVERGELNAEIALVLSNRRSAAGLERARERGVPTEVIPSHGVNRSEYDRQLIARLQTLKPDLICLAGYMRLLSPEFIRAFEGRILNIHPSLLPAFPGLDAQGQALEHGVKITGCTVHLVDEGLDSGPILMQAAVPVEDGDTEQTLSARILAQEHRLYPLAIRRFLLERWVLEGRRLRWTSSASA